MKQILFVALAGVSMVSCRSDGPVGGCNEDTYPFAKRPSPHTPADSSSGHGDVSLSASKEGGSYFLKIDHANLDLRGLRVKPTLSNSGKFVKVEDKYGDYLQGDLDGEYRCVGHKRPLDGIDSVIELEFVSDGGDAPTFDVIIMDQNKQYTQRKISVS